MTDPIRRPKSFAPSLLPKNVGDIGEAAAHGARADEAGAQGNKVLYGQPPATRSSSLGPTKPSRDASGFLACLLKAQGGGGNPLVQAAIAAMQQRNDVPLP